MEAVMAHCWLFIKWRSCTFWVCWHELRVHTRVQGWRDEVAQGERRRKAEVELGLLLFCALLGACWECNQLRGAHLFRCCSRLEMLSWTHPETMLNWAPHSPVNLAHEISHHDILEVGRKSMWLLRDWRSQYFLIARNNISHISDWLSSQVTLTRERITGGSQTAKDVQLCLGCSHSPNPHPWKKMLSILNLLHSFNSMTKVFKNIAFPGKNQSWIMIIIVLKL